LRRHEWHDIKSGHDKDESNGVRTSITAILQTGDIAIFSMYEA